MTLSPHIAPIQYSPSASIDDSPSADNKGISAFNPTSYYLVGNLLSEIDPVIHGGASTLALHPLLPIHVPDIIVDRLRDRQRD